MHCEMVVIRARAVAAQILRELVTTYPDQPQYGVALVQLITRKMDVFRKTASSHELEEYAQTERLSRQLLGQYPTVPEIITTAVSFQISYISFRRRTGDTGKARRETERLTGILDVLACNPDVPDTVHEQLIGFQLDRLDRLDRLVRDRREKETRELREQLANILSRYHRARLAEFQNRLKRLEKNSR